MQKSTLINCFIIIGLLVLCVVTLLAVYATASESSLLLLHESFNDLDVNKWRLKISSCTEDGPQFNYTKEDEENGFKADEILRFYSNDSGKHGRELLIKREALNECFSCINCNPVFSASLETRSSFYATTGKIEIRAKFHKNNWMRFRIGVISNTSKTEVPKAFAAKREEVAANDFVQSIVIFMSVNNYTILESVIPDNDFHIYKIKWDSNKITFIIDQSVVDERKFKSGVQEMDFPNDTAQPEDVLLSQPFYLSIRVDFGEKFLVSSETVKWSKDEFLNKTWNQETNDFAEASILELDYIKLFRTMN